MGKPHKHAELIKAWADGAEIEGFINNIWLSIPSPLWNEVIEYRVKPSSVKVKGPKYKKVLMQDSDGTFRIGYCFEDGAFEHCSYFVKNLDDDWQQDECEVTL